MKTEYEIILNDAHELLIRMANIKYLDIPTEKIKEYSDVYDLLNQFLKNNNVQTGIKTKEVLK